jgi:hypothetical protein
MVTFTHEQAEQILRRTMSAFNAGVRTGDFTPFVDLFSADAAIDFEGIPERGPIEGRDAIAARYRDEPPDDEIRIKRWTLKDQTIVAEFYWSDVPEAIGGCFTIEPRDDRIARLTIALGGPGSRLR